MTECLALCPTHKMPCELAVEHEIHKHKTMAGPLKMTHYWVAQPDICPGCIEAGTWIPSSRCTEDCGFEPCDHGCAHTELVM